MDCSYQLQAALGDADLVVLGDTAAPSAAALLGGLRRIGVTTVLLTEAHCAAPPPSLVGAFFSCSPADKARLVRRFREEGSRVAFIGLGGSDEWGMMCADVRIDSPGLLANFGILPS
jgi:cation transport ATPase